MSWSRLLQRKLDLSIAGFGILLGMVILLVDLTGTPPRSLTDVGLGPTALPNTVAVLSILLSLVILFQASRAPAISAEDEDEAYGDEDDEPAVSQTPRQEAFHLLRLSVLFALYLLGMSYIGFVVATILFLIVFYRMLQAASWTKNIIIAVAFTVALYWVFAQLFSIQLPSNTLDLLGW